MTGKCRRVRKMLFQAILITLFASQSTRASHKDSILLQKWSIPSWEAVRDTDLFEVDQDLEDVAYAIFAKDGYLDTHLGVCPNNSRYIERIQDISHRIKKLKIYSELVSHGLLTIVQELRTYDGSEELLSNDSKTEGILRKYFLDGRQFLIEFRNNILSDPNDNSSLVTEYKEYRKFCRSVSSELQDVADILRYIQWIYIKIYETVQAAYTLYRRFGFHDAQRRNVILAALSEYNLKTIKDEYDGIVDISIQSGSQISLAVRTRDIRDIKDEGIEIKLLKKVFVQECHDYQAAHPPPDGASICTTITTAPALCAHFIPGARCPVYLTCRKMRCQYLKKNQTVCKEENDGVRRYKFYAPRDEWNPWLHGRLCDEAYTVGPRHEFPLNSPETWVTPCDCVCQNDTSYYYSTKPVMANWTENMVITGAKLQLINDKLLVISIQQSKLLANGVIDARTTSDWLLPDISDINYRQEISLDEMNAIDLARYQLPMHEVMIGLSLFRGYKDTTESNHSIQLRIFSHGYDYWKGKLIGDQNVYYTPNLSSEMVRTDLVRRSYTIKVIRDFYVMFTVSSGKFDGGQTTVPFIDQAEVVPDTLTPLSGAGFYLKKVKDRVIVGIELLTFNLKFILIRERNYKIE